MCDGGLDAPKLDELVDDNQALILRLREHYPLLADILTSKTLIQDPNNPVKFWEDLSNMDQRDSHLFLLAFKNMLSQLPEQERISIWNALNEQRLNLRYLAVLSVDVLAEVQSAIVDNSTLEK